MRVIIFCIIWDIIQRCPELLEEMLHEMRPGEMGSLIVMSLWRSTWVGCRSDKPCEGSEPSQGFVVVRTG